MPRRDVCSDQSRAALGEAVVMLLPLRFRTTDLLLFRSAVMCHRFFVMTAREREREGRDKKERMKDTSRGAQDRR
jgi:hypothetical protein